MTVEENTVQQKSPVAAHFGWHAKAISHDSLHFILIKPFSDSLYLYERALSSKLKCFFSQEKILMPYFWYDTKDSWPFYPHLQPLIKFLAYCTCCRCLSACFRGASQTALIQLFVWFTVSAWFHFLHMFRFLPVEPIKSANSEIVQQVELLNEFCLLGCLDCELSGSVSVCNTRRKRRVFLSGLWCRLMLMLSIFITVVCTLRQEVLNHKK